MNRKSKSGLTLLELVIALGLWLLLSTGVFFLWHHTSGSTTNILRRQSAFEQARGTMDALVTSIQMSSMIELTTNEQNLLDSIVVWGYNAQGELHDFIFEFRPNDQEVYIGRARTTVGRNEFSNNIAAIYIVYTAGRHMDITIYTACQEPIVIHGSVDVRYKYVVLH